MENKNRYFWNNGFYVATNENELEIFKDYFELTEEEYKKLCSTQTPQNKMFARARKPIDSFGNIIYEDMFTVAETAKINAEKELAENLKYLADTDYIVIKMHELAAMGESDTDTTLKFQEVQPKRVKAREKIKELEKELKK